MNQQTYIDECVKRASDELCREIDFNVLATCFKDAGWIELEFDSLVSNKQAIDMKQWIEDNCRGNNTSHGRRFLFELESDAVNFSLRWA